MYRLQLLNMCSRETHRLPVGKIARKVGANGALPVEIRDPLSMISPSDRFIVYYVADGEFRQNKGRFALVEVSGTNERILEYGEARAIKFCENEYAMFIGTGATIGQFAYYCTMPTDDLNEGRLLANADGPARTL